MPRESNFLLGNGERLTSTLKIVKASGNKNPPYSLAEAKERMTRRLDTAVQEFASLPSAACPGERVVAVMTMHPRYTAKSEFPAELLRKVGLRSLGSKARLIKPDSWGIKKVPDDGVGLAEDLFVEGTREVFEVWREEAYNWKERNAVAQLTHIESLDAFRAQDKVKAVPVGRDEAYFETVLHCGDEATDAAVLDAFYAYAESLRCRALMDRKRTVNTVTFIPVYAPVHLAELLARFSFVRVLRGMPPMRPSRPTILRIKGNGAFEVVLPDADALAPDIRTVVFDGGLPGSHPVGR